MPICVDSNTNTYTLHTTRTTYQMKVDELGVLLHTYYGPRTDGGDLSRLIYHFDRGFSGNPHEKGRTEKGYSLDVLPQEYSCFGTGDYRITALRVRQADGSRGCDLRFAGATVSDGKYALPGLPAVHADLRDAETLTVTLRDTATALTVELLYGVLPALDVITRAVRITNSGTAPVVLEKAASLNLDWQYDTFDWVTFHSRHNMERNFQRAPLQHGVQAIGSVRGTSSHHYNPFAILCGPDATETQGLCYGVSFVYPRRPVRRAVFAARGHQPPAGGIPAPPHPHRPGTGTGRGGHSTGLPGLPGLAAAPDPLLKEGDCHGVHPL